MNHQDESGSRRNIAPEFVDAVRRGLDAVGNMADAVTFAKVMWTSESLAIGKPLSHEILTSPNPHQNGANVNGIVDTIKRMHGKVVAANFVHATSSPDALRADNGDRRFFVLEHDALHPGYAVPKHRVGDVRKTYHGKQMYTGTGWVDCDGRTLLTVDYQALFEHLGYMFGGTGGSFMLPDLRDSEGQVHAESALPSRGMVLANHGREPDWKAYAAAERTPIKTWRERIEGQYARTAPHSGDEHAAMLDEIADLRAALAIPASAATPGTQDALEEALMTALTEHTNLSTDGIDECVPVMLAVIPSAALPFAIVPTEGIDPALYERAPGSDA